MQPLPHRYNAIDTLYGALTAPTDARMNFADKRNSTPVNMDANAASRVQSAPIWASEPGSTKMLLAVPGCCVLSGVKSGVIRHHCAQAAPARWRCRSSRRGACFLRSRGARAESIRRLPLPPGRRRQPHLASSLGPRATPPPILPLPCLSAQRKCERQPQRGSRGLLECPLFHVRLVLLPTAAPPAPRLLLLHPGMQVPPRPSGLVGPVQDPMRELGFH